MGDTLVIRDARSVTIVTNDSLQKIKVNGKESDANYVYENTIQLVDSNYVDERRIYRDLKALEFPLNKKDSNYRTIDIYGTAHAGLDWIGLYVKYSPMSVFKDWRGPKFQSISFGIYL